MFPPAFRDEVVAYLFDELSLKQRFPTDEIEDDSLGFLANKIAIVLFIQVQNVVNDFFAGFERHGLAAFMVLIAI